MHISINAGMKLYYARIMTNARQASPYGTLQHTHSSSSARRSLAAAVWCAGPASDAELHP